MKRPVKVCILLVFTTLSWFSGISLDRLFASTDIPVLGFQVDVDTRPDIDGLQTTMTAVKGIPSGVQAFVGVPGGPVASTEPGSLVKAELSGPGLGNGIITLVGAPNQAMEIPPLGAAGDYQLFNIRLENSQGKVLLRRDPARSPVVINVIDKLLVTQVTTRPLTLEEIQSKGIVIDESNFTVLNFTVGLTLGSEQVVIDLPVAIPTTTQAAISLDPPQFTQLPSVQGQFSNINIPNFSLTGFSLRPPPELENELNIRIPPINGVIVIPGNIAFLHQFFSVILQAANVAPEGSGLTVQNAQAAIALPLGDDAIQGTGDDPLRVARTQAGGVQEVLPLLDDTGAALIPPQRTSQAEFLVEGLREGTHGIDFDITGDLFVPALGRTVTLTGKAAGVVQVKNPTFSLVLAHPKVVREGEEYPLFATVTNTSASPANLFRLQLLSRSLSGTSLAAGETDTRTLDRLAPGDAQTFEFRLVARTTGKVTGTVFLADEGINGSFVLKTGVGDTGIPLSPDTLVLPQTVDYLPDTPDLVFAAVRMLGQAYSVATAPAGALPPEIARINKAFVFDRAVKVAQAGLHARFGETATQAAQDIVLDWFGNDAGRLDLLHPGDTAAQDRALKDMEAFDGLRRRADAGHDLSDVLGQLIGQSLTSQGLSTLQGSWAETFASRPPHLSFGGSSSGPPVALRLIDAEGRVLGRLDPLSDLVRDLPFADLLPLSPSSEILLTASPQSANYTAEFSLPESSTLDLSMVVPSTGASSVPTALAGGGPVGPMVQVIWPAVVLPSGTYGRMTWTRAGPNTMQFEIDTNGDGTADLVLDPVAEIPVVDGPPTVLGVHQWGKGGRPGTNPDFASGDPMGRMVGVLFSEEVTSVTAEALTGYSVPRNQGTGALLQPDRRLVFVVLEKPVGPFVPRDLTVSGVTDMSGNRMSAATYSIIPDPDRGVGGTFFGRVLSVSGDPIPFALVKYIQPLSFVNLLEGGCLGDLDVKDFVIATYQADFLGRFDIDYILQDGFPPPCPSNADVWLNESNASGTPNFKLEALDPETGEIGKVSSRVQFEGQRMSFDVVIRGFGAIVGTVYDAAGNVITGGDPGTADRLQVIAHNISTGEVYASWIDAAGHYAFPRSFIASDGSRTQAPQVAVGNVVLQSVHPARGLTAVDTVNLPAAGVTVTRDLVMFPATHYGIVTGRVMEFDGASGAANVPVQVASNGAVMGSAVTDDQGFFRFESVPAGDVELRAFRQSTFEQAGAKSFLTGGQVQDVVLVFPGSGGTVRGIVRDALGNAIAGATVAGGPTLTQTDVNGFFEITGLPVGSFTIFGQAAGSRALGTVDIDTLGPTDVQDVVVTLQPVGSVAGSVFEADGVTPISGQKVQLWLGNRGVMAETFTDGAGVYGFPEVPLGDYDVRAVRADHGDGGQAFTSVRFAGDVRDADIRFRGLGEIKGRVVQDNGTPALTDVIITRKVWRIVSDAGAAIPNVYLDFARSLGGANEQLAGAVDRMLSENGLGQAAPVFFFLVDEPVLLKSDILGPSGEVTGQFHFSGPATGGPFTIAAFGPFLTPAEVTGEIPLTADPVQRIVDVGDIILVPATSSVTGTVYLPDGVTPVGENVRVKLRSLDNSGDLRIAGSLIAQPVLPEIDVVTGPDGRFAFPLVLRGRFVLTADTGVPDPAIRADSAATMNTTQFEDAAGNRLLNVRLFSQAGGVAPQGDTVDVDLRLHDVAGVAVQVMDSDGVTPVPFAEVTLNTASTLDGAFEPGFLRQVADPDGRIDFFPVIEGSFSVTAVKPGTPSRGLANGVIPVNPDNGHIENVIVTLGAVTTASGQVITANIFGSVTGIVHKADGTPLANPAQVTVRSAGIEILATTDATGVYRADNVPGGFFTVEAFEPFTARRGSGSGRITVDGAVVDVPITLVGLGTVAGEVFSNTGASTLSGVDVLLLPSGSFTDPLVSRTDVQGQFSLPGVPLGDYTVKANDPLSGLSGQASGVMARDGDTNTTDVFLEAAGQITGTVYAAGVTLDANGVPVDAAGVPLASPPVIAGASVALSGAGLEQVLQTGADGRFASGTFLRVGNYQLTARPSAGNDGTFVNAVLRYEGQITDVAMVLRGQGVIEGVVLDSAGTAPVATARVTLHSNSPFSAGAVTRLTGPDGQFRFDTVPVGDFSLSVQTTLEAVPLGASVTSTLGGNGDAVRYVDGDADNLHDAIRLQPAGSIIGKVLLEDGITFAQGAVIAIETVNLRVVHTADGSGIFRFDGLPLGDYTISIREPVSNGVAGRVATLTLNGETMDFGTILLDSSRPHIVRTQPLALASGVSPVTPIVLTMNERIDPASVDASTFRVLVDGLPVVGTLSVSPFGPEVVWSSAQPLPDMKVITVIVQGVKVGFEGQVLTPGIRDLAGLGMLGDLRFSFTTGDTTAPLVAGLSPSNRAAEVDLASVIRVEFSEPVSRSSIRAFTLIRDGVTVPGTVNTAPILGGRVLVFTPTTLLLPNSRYVAQIDGPVSDLAGNGMAQTAITTTFDTIDTLAPLINALTVPLNTPLIAGATVPVTAETASSDVAAAEFFVNGQLVLTDTAGPYTAPVQLDPLLAPTVTASAIAIDLTGNRSVSFDLPLSITPNQPPGVSILTPATGGTVSLGQLVTVQVRATDDLSLEQVSFTVDGGAIASGANTVSGVSDVVTDFAFRVPTGLVPGTQIRVRAAAKDSLLQRAESNGVTLTVEDRLPPVVNIGNPANDSTVEPGQSVSVFVRGDDTGGIASLRLTATGGAVFDEIRPVAPASSPAADTFVVTIPVTALPTETVLLTAEAVDTSGNIGSRSIHLRIRDHIAPQVTLRTQSGATRFQAGDSVTVIVDAMDEVSVAEVGFELTGFGGGGTRVAVTPPSTSATRSFTFTIPAGAATGETAQVTGLATDTTGNAAVSGGLALSIADLTPPTVSVLSPLDGAEVVPGETVQVEVRVTDNIGATELTLTASGAVVSQQAFSVDPSQSSLTHTFDLPVPIDAQGGATILLTAAARDASGNQGTAQVVTVRVAVPPPPPALTLFPAALILKVGDSATLTLLSSIPAPAGGISVTLTDAPGGVVSVTTPVVIPEGQTQAAVSITAMALGTATLTANATGFVGSQAQVNVAVPRITGISPTSVLQGTVVEATITGELLGGASAITLSGGLTGTIRSGGTETSIPVTLVIPPDAPIGAYDFALTLPSGELTSGAVRLSVGATFTGPTQTLSAPVSVFVPVSGSGGSAGQGVGVSPAVSVFVPVSGSGGAAGQGVGVSPAVSVFVPVSGTGGAAGQGVGVSPAVSVFVPVSGSGGAAGQGVGVSPAVSLFVPASGSGGSIGQGVAVSPPVSVETIP